MFSSTYEGCVTSFMFDGEVSSSHVCETSCTNDEVAGYPYCIVAVGASWTGSFMDHVAVPS